MKVMIVDDEASTRDILATMAKDWGYEVTTAAGGEEAWQVLRDEAKPVIAVLDAAMPNLGGLELCARLKKEKPAGPRYVILLAVTGDQDEMDRGLQAGADDYITKPVSAAMLRARLATGRRILEYQHTLETLTHELQAKNKEFSRLATGDGLTGIAGRGQFDDTLAAEWRRALRDGSKLSLVLLDIDYFKAYNDTYGHLAGDECLKKVARVLATTIARAGDLAARFSGEEFAVLLPGTDSLGALVVAEAIRVAVAALAIDHKASAIHRHVTVSVGTATVIPDGILTPEALVAKADHALYLAKISGRNIVKQVS
jgi:diguanylate cyclase (GGDEF)-like protein